MTILVAGGTGTLGSRVVDRLVARRLPVRILTRDAARVHAHVAEYVDVVEGDVRDAASLVPALRGVDTLISAIQGFVGSGGVTPASVDRDGNANLIDAASAAGAAFVLMSVVGAGPDSSMELCRMKYAAEERLRVSGLAWTIVRATAFLETWIALLQHTANGSGRPLVFGRGDNPINFVSVTDVASLVERVTIDATTRGSVLEICGPQNLTLCQLAAAVQQAAGRTDEPRHVPQTVLRMLSILLRPIRPDLARQAGSALAFDTADLAFEARGFREARADLPQTTVFDVLATGALFDLMTFGLRGNLVACRVADGRGRGTAPATTFFSERRSVSHRVGNAKSPWCDQRARAAIVELGLQSRNHRRTRQ